MTNRLTVLKVTLWMLVGMLAAITVVRFTQGLGAVTNLSDATPWGLWVAFDVMAGVALAAGGFVLAAAVYIFGLERYRPFVRPAILTALLGYLAVAIGLLYDLGLPWNIWHPMIHWQYHSVLFEVAMCVMFYLTVLGLEFAPVILEHPWFSHPLFQRIHMILKKVTIPLVIAGIVLSTLHQSSLGSLFLITPYRLHPLWYSPIIYVLFFVSAVALGLMTAVLESLFSGFFLGHKIHMRPLSRLAAAGGVVLTLYALLRLGDLAVRGVLMTSIDGSWQSLLFVFELAISAIIPIGLLCFRPVRSSTGGLAVCTSLAVCGIVLNRINVCIVAFARPAGEGYFPSWMEFAVSLGIIAGGVLIFIFFAERFRVFEDEQIGLPPAKPSYDPATLHDLMPNRVASVRRYSLAAISAAAVTVIFLPVRGDEPPRISALAPRTVEGVAITHDGGQGRRLALPKPGEDVPPGGQRLPLLVIDGNRNDTLVLFDHAGHVEREGDEQSCAICHHLDMPLDRNTSCSECHRDMYEPTSTFDHELHVSKLDGNRGCIQCHVDSSLPKTYETTTACDQCHEVPAVPAPVIATPSPRWHAAPSYLDAMHGLCITCHQKEVEQSPEPYLIPLDRCDNCHDADRAEQRSLMAPAKMTRAGSASDKHEA